MIDFFKRTMHSIKVHTPRGSECELAIIGNDNLPHLLTNYDGTENSELCLRDGETYAVSIRTNGYLPVMYSLTIDGKPVQTGKFSPWIGDTHDVYQGPVDSKQRFTFISMNGPNGHLLRGVKAVDIGIVKVEFRDADVITERPKENFRGLGGTGLSGKKGHTPQYNRDTMVPVGQPVTASIFFFEDKGVNPL